MVKRRNNNTKKQKESRKVFATTMPMMFVAKNDETKETQGKIREKQLND